MSSPSLIYSFFKDSALQLKKNYFVQYVSMPVNFQITFDINPKSIVSGNVWQNIFHISSNNTDYSFGSGANPRNPGLWFYPGTLLFYLCLGVADKSTQDCIDFSSGQEMPTNSWTSITIDVSNGKMTLTALKADGKSFSKSLTIQNNSARKELDNCYFYASDPWYSATDSQIKNFNIYSYDSTSSSSVPTGLNFEAFTSNKNDSTGFIRKDGKSYYENALSIFSGKKVTKAGVTTTINCKNKGFSQFGLTDSNPGNVMISFFGSFRPNKSGVWTFYFGTNGYSNDDISTFWFGDNALNPSTSNTSYKVDWKATEGNQDSKLYSWKTPELTKDNYYPVLLNWGNSGGNAVLGFGFTEPSSSSISYDMKNLFYTYQPAKLTTPSLFFEACKNTQTTLVKAKSYGTINMPMNYRVELKIYPTATVSAWSNIMTIVNNNNNYDFSQKDTVSRNPGLWFNGSTFKILFSVGVPRFTEYYINEYPSEGLTKNTWNTVIIDVIDGQLKVDLTLGNGKKYNKQTTISNYGFRKEMKNSIVYLSDPWADAAKAYVKDVKVYSYDSGTTDNTSCYYQLSDLEAQCYVDRYPDLKNAYGSDLNAVKNHWTDKGCKESRRNECSAPQKSSGRYSYIGCYGDSSTRAIPTFNGVVKTVDDCAGIAEKSKANVFGVQYGGECWTGIDVNAAKKYSEKFHRDSCKNMGGSWGNNVYVRDEEFPPPAPSTIDLSSPDFSTKLNEGFLNRELDLLCKKPMNIDYGNYILNYNPRKKYESGIETFTDNPNEQLSIGDRQLYNQVFCDLYPTNNGFNTCSNCTFKGTMNQLDKKTMASETDCLNDCKSKKNCSSYTFDTLATTDNCEQFYTFPQDIDYENSANKNSGYSLLFPYDYQKLDSQQKTNVQTKCVNQYLNNTYNIGSNMNDCIKIDNSNSSLSKLEMDPECTWNKMSVNGTPAIREDSVYLDDMGFTASKSDKELDNYKKLFSEVVNADVENKSANEVLMKYNQKFKEYNTKLEKEDSQYQSDYDNTFKENINKLTGELDTGTKKINQFAKIEEFTDPQINRTESYLKFVTLMIIVLLFFIIMCYVKSSMK